MQDYPGATAQQTLGYFSLSPAPAARNHWAPRANPSPTLGRIPLLFSILPRLSLLPGDLTRGPRAEAEAEKEWEKGKAGWRIYYKGQ